MSGSGFSLDMKELDSLLENFQKAGNLVQEAATEAVTEVGERILSDAKANCPVGPDRIIKGKLHKGGTLRNSGEGKYLGHNRTAFGVRFNTPYAAAVNFGLKSKENLGKGHPGRVEADKRKNKKDRAANGFLTNALKKNRRLLRSEFEKRVEDKFAGRQTETLTRKSSYKMEDSIR